MGRVVLERFVLMCNCQSASVQYVSISV